MAMIGIFLCPYFECGGIWGYMCLSSLPSFLPLHRGPISYLLFILQNWMEFNGNFHRIFIMCPHWAPNTLDPNSQYNFTSDESKSWITQSFQAVLSILRLINPDVSKSTNKSENWLLYHKPWQKCFFKMISLVYKIFCWHSLLNSMLSEKKY